MERSTVGVHKVVVGIKALNEEKHIETAIVSALGAIDVLLKSRPEFNACVILADSGSVDQTLAIARRFPIKITQFTNLTERSCGAGAQLAFQHAFENGETGYFYLLDGDMVLAPDFLLRGIEFLEMHPDTAAVGGIVNERVTEAEEFEIRAQKQREARSGLVDRLDCGGLYRSDAIKQVNYFADRNLHAFEEFDLGARLSSAGWKLQRVPWDAVDHYGHATGGYRLMLKRLRSGYTSGCGEVLRGAIGNPHLSIVLRKLSHVRHSAAVFIWWAALICAALYSPVLIVALIVLPLAFLTWRRRSLNLGTFSLVSWNAIAFGLISGFFRGRVNPTTPIASTSIQ